MLLHRLQLEEATDLSLVPLSSIPKTRGVFALFGRETSPGDAPYANSTTNLHRRLSRLLDPRSENGRENGSSARLNLRDRVAAVEWTETGSDFESLLLLYRISPHPRERLKLRPASYLRLAFENRFPRVYVTNRLSQKALALTYGPFPTRLAADRYSEASLDLFKLRRCQENLEPHPAHPGCVYSEMHMCLAPCYAGCTDEQYAAEAAAVRGYFDTRGESLLETLEREREAAASALEFERAAELHDRYGKVRAAVQLAGELAGPVAALTSIIIQPAAKPEHVALFLLSSASITGPVLFSVAGMRHANEQSGSTSLFAHPAQIAPLPLAEENTPLSETANSEAPVPALSIPTLSIEDRLAAAISELERSHRPPATVAEMEDMLSLLARWCRKPPAQRVGELFLNDADLTAPAASGEAQPESPKPATVSAHPDSSWPLKKMLRAISRVFVRANFMPANQIRSTDPAAVNIPGSNLSAAQNAAAPNPTPTDAPV